MKLQVQNDLHIEFDNQTRHTLPGGDTLLLSGDVCVASLLRPHRTDKDARRHRRVCDEFFKTECAKYNRVFYIMGNHEHYRGVFDHTADTLREYLEGTNVRLLDKEWVDLNDEYRLFGGTLWTDYDNGDWFAMQAAKDSMNDHRIIKKLRPVPGQEPAVGYFLPSDAMDDFRSTCEELVDGLSLTDKKVVVMSHHAPCVKSVHPRYAGSKLNFAYYSELGNWIADHPAIKYWFHGHTHDSFDYEVGECRVICNPRGYVGYELNTGFNPTFELEI